MADGKRTIYEFAGEVVTVYWNARRCIHAEECIHGLPTVFDPQRRPWIEPDRGSAEEVKSAVLACPTGALHFGSADGRDEPAAAVNTVRIEPNGPLHLAGRLTIELSGGETLEENRAALCRCGDSANKPFCDNKHLEKEFEDDGTLGESQLADASTDRSDLHIDLAANGPLLLAGPLSVSGSDSPEQSGTRGAFCRCGASNNKPYCDGSHTAIGFTSD